MQSKKSFFNFAIFSKNIGRTWLIALGTLIVMFLVFCMNVMTIGGNVEYSLYTLIKGMAEKSWYIAAIVPIIVCVIIFSYMQKARSISFYHALPVCRRGLFISSVLSGLFVMYIPNLLVYAYFLIVSNNLGFCPTEALTKWLVVLCVEELLYFSVGVLAMILAGNSFVAIGMYIAVIFLPKYIFEFLDGTVKPIVFGYTGSDKEVLLKRFSPGDVFGNIEFDMKYDMVTPATMTVKNFASTVTVMILISIALLVAAVLIYKRRESEASGDFIAINKFKPVAVWCLAFSFAVLMTSLLTGGFSGDIIAEYSVALKIFIVVSFVLFGFVGYIAVSLLMLKDKKDIKKKIRPAAVFAGFMFIFGIGVLVFASCLENYKPDNDDITELNVDFEGNTVQITQDDLLNEFKDIQTKAVEGKENWLKNRGSLGKDEICITYTLDSGRYVSRSYQLSKTDGVGDALNGFFDSNLLRLVYGDFDYNTVILCPSDDLESEYGYGVKVDASTEVARLVYDALAEDVAAGRMNFTEALRGKEVNSDEGEILFYVWFMKIDQENGGVPEAAARGYFTKRATATMKAFEELIAEYGLR